MSSDDQLLATSVHESGHGVMALLVGLLPLYVTNIRDETSLGRMYWAHIGRRTAFRIIESDVTSDERALALVNVAGVAAVRVLLDTPAELAGPDNERARAFARATSRDEEAGVRALLTVAEDVFTNEHVRNATLAVAYRLVRERVIASREIEALIEAVGLQRGHTTILTTPSTRPTSRKAHKEHPSVVLGETAFTNRSSSLYFFGNDSKPP